MSNQSPTTPSNEKVRPPMPPLMMKVMNPIMKAILRSPLHGRMSEHIMILTFRGRKSGKLFSTPVGYMRKGNKLQVFTSSNWWKNFIGSAPVTMLIKRQTYQGTAQPVQDAEQIKSVAHVMMKEYGEKRSRQFGFWLDNPDAPADQVVQQLRGMRFVEITLAQ